jgi:hypothetical protein
MKIKSILFPVAVIVFVAAFSYYIGGSMRGANSEQQPIHIPVKTADYSVKIREIEADFEQRRQKIEDYYANVFQQLLENRNKALRSPGVDNETDNARLVEQAYNTGSKSYGYTRLNSRVSSGETALARGSPTGTTISRVKNRPSSDYGLKTSETDKAANDMVSEYNLDLDHYQRQKACALSDLEKEKKLAIAAVYNQQAGEAAQANPKARGTVTGILSSDGASLAVVDGKVLSEGQSENGVKVIKIRTDCVEFRYAKKSWSQKVNEPPSSNWP